jgi:ankyrin repeat protein
MDLHVAIRDGDIRKLKTFLEGGFDVNRMDGCGWTPLHLATGKGWGEYVTLLLKAGAEKEAKDDRGSTPLHFAAEFGREECITLLLKAGAEKEAKDDWVSMLKKRGNGVLTFSENRKGHHSTLLLEWVRKNVVLSC